jgi:predicted DNA-binding transcriptional regulator AlpA
MDLRVRTKPIEYISEKRLRVMMGDASPASIWRWTKAGILPPPRQLGPNRKAWLLHELEPVLEAFPVADCKKVAPGCTTRGRKKSSTRKED